MVWAVHMISPTRYSEPRHQRLVEALLEHNVGVICCPSAAIGMRQLRPLLSPTDNSIPRLLELGAAGVHVRLGTDNIADICSPSTTADLLDEVFVLSAAIRYYQVDVLARLAAGQPLSEEERERVRAHLRQNDIEITKVLNAAAQDPA
jgi:adenosine deaminase